LALPSALRKAQDSVTQISLKKGNNIDCALPGPHMKKLYHNLVYQQAVILCQLRMGKSRLKGYLDRIGAVETDSCDCDRAPLEQ